MGVGISKGPSTTETSSTSDILSQLFSQLTNTSNTSNASTTGSTTESGTTSGGTSGTTSRNLAPQQYQMLPQLSSLIQQLATDPKSFVAPSQEAAREEVNGNYSGVGDALRQQFMTGGGGGGSGKYGKAALQSDLARRGALSQADVTANANAAMLPLTAAQMMQQFLGIDFGSSTNSNSTATSTGGTQSAQSSTGTDTGSVDTTGSSSSDRQVDQKGKSSQGWGFGASVAPFA